MQLRPYQEEAIESIFKYFVSSTGNPLIAMPTGTGKGLVIAYLIKRIMTAWPDQRIVMATHVKELIEQNMLALLREFPTAPAGIYSAGLKKRDTHCPVSFVGIDSVSRRPEAFGYQDLLLIDEAHLVSPKDDTRYLKFEKGLKEVNPNLKTIGFTATPYRTGQGMLTDEGGLFTDICFDNTAMEDFNMLIDDGYLAPLVPKHTGTQINVDGVHSRMGDFIASELDEAIDLPTIRAAIDETVELGKERKHWLIFANSIEKTEYIAERLHRVGINAAFVHSKMTGDRKQILTNFKAGKIQALVNMGVLTTGFDFPALDMIVMLRPTKSPSLWVQMLGRGTRPCEGKDNCLVLDFAGNTARLGPINDVRIPLPKGKKGGVAPVRLCDECSCYCHASLKACPHCGCVFPVHNKLLTIASTEALIARVVEPKMETFKVDRVVYKRHIKAGGFDSLKATYYCGLRSFSQWVPIENPRGQGLARRWWLKHQKEIERGKVPETVTEALNNLGALKEPITIVVWINKKPYPEVKNHEFKCMPEISVRTGSG